MPRFLKDGRFIIACTSIGLIIIIVITFGNYRRMTWPEAAVGEVVTPVQKWVSWAAGGVFHLFERIEKLRNMEQEYYRLKEKVADLENQLVDIAELREQNERLKKLLGFAQGNKELEMTGARVIARDPGNWFNVFLIDKGSKDGVMVNAAVVTDRGLVGRVIQVGSHWAKVRPIVDERSSVSAIIQRTRDHGIVKGDSSYLDIEEGTCRMIYLPPEADVVPGDKVITSGFERIFPKGIYIGEIKKVIWEKRDHFKTAIIEPGVDFHRIEEVLVIISVHDIFEQ